MDHDENKVNVFRSVDSMGQITSQCVLILKVF